LEKRKTIILDKPAIKALEELRLAAKVRPIKLLKGSSPLFPQVIGVRGVDTGLESIKEAKRREWRERGYPEGLITMGISLADSWIQSMAAAFAPDMPEVREAIIRASYGKALEVADHWVRAMGETAGLRSSFV